MCKSTNDGSVAYKNLVAVVVTGRLGIARKVRWRGDFPKASNKNKNMSDKTMHQSRRDRALCMHEMRNEISDIVGWICLPRAKKRANIHATNSECIMQSHRRESALAREHGACKQCSFHFINWNGYEISNSPRNIKLFSCFVFFSYSFYIFPLFTILLLVFLPQYSAFGCDLSVGWPRSRATKSTIPIIRTYVRRFSISMESRVPMSHSSFSIHSFSAPSRHLIVCECAHCNCWKPVTITTVSFALNSIWKILSHFMYIFINKHAGRNA